MNPEPRAGAKIFGLDFLRVFAVLCALAAHSRWLFSSYDNTLTKGVNFAGFAAVEVFFVLSGYLIGGSLYRMFLKPDFDFAALGRFFNRRSIRILPNYLLVVVLNLLVAYIIGYKAEQSWRYFLFLQNFSNPMLPFFPESWSMSIKELSYLLFPYALWLFFKWRKIQNRNLLFLWLTLVFLIAAILTKVHFYLENADGLTAHEWNIALRSVLVYRFDAVFLGVLFYWIQANFPIFWKANARLALLASTSILGLVVYLVAILRFSTQSHPFFWSIVVLPLLSLSWALVLPFFSQWKIGPKTISPIISYIGKLSYAIYLVHYSLILWPLKHFLNTDAFSGLQLIAVTIAYFLLSAVASFILYSFWEKPFLRLRKPMYGKN